MNERPTENDILRFVVALCRERDDEEQVGRVIAQEMAGLPETLHATYLSVTLRVVVAQMYGALARRLELSDPGMVDLALSAQELANEGRLGFPDLQVIDGERT